MTEPPFNGTIEFTLALRAFDTRTVRKAKVLYSYTPPWPYYRSDSADEFSSPSQLDLGLLLLAIPRLSRKRVKFSTAKEPYWVPVGHLLKAGVLTNKMHTELRARIDAAALDADRLNRTRAGLVVPAFPEQI